MDVLVALLPPVVMAVVFIALAVTALRSTGGTRRKRNDDLS